MLKSYRGWDLDSADDKKKTVHFEQCRFASNEKDFCFVTVQFL